MTCRPLFYIKRVANLKTIVFVLRGGQVGKSVLGDKNVGSFIMNSALSNFLLNCHLRLPVGFHDTFPYEK